MAEGFHPGTHVETREYLIVLAVPTDTRVFHCVRRAIAVRGEVGRWLMVAVAVTAVTAKAVEGWSGGNDIAAGQNGGDGGRR